MLIRPALLATLASLMLAPSAFAAASSQITSPADPVYTFDGLTMTVGDHVTVSGTATDMPVVALVCYPTDGTGPVGLADNVPVLNHQFSATVKLTPPEVSASCILHAVPAGTTPPGNALSPFGGLRVLPTYLDQWRTPDGDLNEYQYTFSGTRGFSYANSPGDQGIGWSALVDPASLVISNSSLSANVLELLSHDGTPGPGVRSEIEVDGAAAYTPYAAAWLPTASGLHWSTPGLPAVSVLSESLDQQTGDATVVTSQPIVKCSPEADAPSNFSDFNTSCTRFVGTGVVLERTYTSGADGRLVGVSDAWRAVGPASHQIDVLYDNNFYGSASGAPALAGFRFPGSSTFQDYAKGATVSVPPGPGTIYYKADRTEPDTGGVKPQGALSYSDAPSSVEFTDTDMAGGSGTGSPEWTMGYRRTIPARGSTTLSFQFAHASGQTDLAAFGDAFERQFRAPVTPPSAGQPQPQTQTQTPTQNSSPAAAVAGLKRGKPRARWSGSRILLDTGLIGTCSQGTGSCSFALVVKAGHKSVGKTTVKLAAGKSKHLTLKLSTKWTKLLMRKHKLKLAVKVTPHGSRATARTITFKAPKRRKH